MNKMTNDFNEEVLVIGEQGSMAWLKQRYPKAIKRTDSLFDAGQYSRSGVFEAMSDARKEMEYEGIPNEYINVILSMSEFAKNGYF